VFQFGHTEVTLVNGTYDFRWLNLIAMKWNFFAGASILVGGLLMKFGAPLRSVVIGVALVGLWNWSRSRGAGPGPRERR
jgi:hypothetical protein